MTGLCLNMIFVLASHDMLFSINDGNIPLARQVAAATAFKAFIAVGFI